jgi:hypothetical protein
MIKLPSKIFMIGAPGSRWSGIAQNIETISGFNTSDRTPERNYTHHNFSGHLGAYYGTGWETDTSLEESNLDKPFTNLDGTRILKSHEWAYKLDEIYEKFSDSWILLVYRPDLSCQAWWHEAGGFGIAYPDYRPYYKNSMNMLNEIIQQNNCIFNFAQKHDLSWHHISGKWIENNFGHYVEPTVKLPDTLVTVLKR